MMVLTRRCRNASLPPRRSTSPGPTRTIDWHEVFASLYPRYWRDAVVDWHGTLGALTPATLPRDTKHLRRLMQTRFHKHVDWPSRRDAVKWASHVFGTAIAVALLDAGHELSAGLVGAVSVAAGGSSSQPFDDVRDYLEGVISETTWTERMRSLGIADVQLGRSEAAGPPHRDVVLAIGSCWPVTPYAE
jgi:hypothetical protein